MLELEHGFRAVDVHVQLDPGRNGEQPQESFGTSDRLEREMNQAGIVRAAVFPGWREEGYLKANNAVARMSTDRPFVALARLNGALDPGESPGARLRNLARTRGDHHVSPGEVEQYAYGDRFVGFMLHPARDGLPDQAVLEQLETVDLPVVVRAGEGFPPTALEASLLEYGFPTVVAHFGGYPLKREFMHATIDLLDRFDNCYVDTSYVRFRDLLERAIIEHPDRVLFGSGAPACHPDVAIMEILTLDVPQDAMRKVFSKNPGRVVDALAP